MGVVDLDCIASNPNSTILYGIGNAENPSGEVDTIIYRSNDNPANATDITWKNYHTFYTWRPEPHYKYPRFGEVDCAVSSKGEFTAFFYNPQVSVMDYANSIPMGIRYGPDDKRMKREIWGSMMYGWTSREFVHQSFYIEKDGVETAVHAVMDETASVIRFGLVDRLTGYLQLAAVWKLVDGRFMMGELTDMVPKLSLPRATRFDKQYSKVSSINTDQRHMVYQNGSLYLYSDTTGLIWTFPFSSPFTTPTQKDFFQATPIPTNRRNMFFQGMRQNSSYLGYLARVDKPVETEFDDIMTMRASTIVLTNPTNATTTNAAITDTSTQTFEMFPNSSHKEVVYLQTIGGRLPGQMPFMAGLTVEGYFGITLGPGSTTTIPVKNFTAPIKNVEDPFFRSRFRNYKGQVGPLYIETSTMSRGNILAAGMGAIIGLLALIYPIMKFDKWLETIRLDGEKRAVDTESLELIARLRSASGHPSADPSSVATALTEPGARGFPLDSSSASMTSHTPLEGLGLTRHPRPNNVVTIGDDEDRSVRIHVDADTQH